jgi:hypothetical protein
MRYFILVAGFAILALVLTMQPGVAQDGKKKVNATQKFPGKISDAALSKVAPKSGFLTEQKALDDLWTAWALKNKAPKVDFTKEIVIVQLALGGPNVPTATYTLDAKGNLTSVAITTLIAGPGFGYSIDVLPRDGIKSYMGKAIEDPKDKK